MNKPSVIRYITTGMLVYFIIMMTGMFIIFTYTVGRAESDSARWALDRVTRHADVHVTKDTEGKLVIDPEVLSEFEDYSIAIIRPKDGYVSGSYPEELGDLTDLKPKSRKFRVLKADGKTYYIYDRKVRSRRRARSASSNKTSGAAESGVSAGSINISGDESSAGAASGKTSGDAEDGVSAGGSKKPGRDPEFKGVYIRAAICADDLSTVYKDIERIFYAFMGLFLIAAVLGVFLLYRNAAHPVHQMCESVKKLSEDPDYTERIENTSMFYETEVMTEAYNKLMDRNEKLIRKQEEFNENVSHEIKTPVAVIRSEAELLQELYKDSNSDEADQALTVIHKQTDRINAMLTELKYMARMEREDFALNKEAMDLSDLAESVCEDMEDAAPGRNIFRYNWEPAEAEIDVSLVMIAVRNIITNAVRYSPEGSEIELSSGIRDGRAWLRVTDHGIGIPEEDLDRIFEPYYQVKSERNSEGFGLGLALAMKIAVKHGGTVLVESEQGKGSTFNLLLPVR